jgi:hypothetical protein
MGWKSSPEGPRCEDRSNRLGVLLLLPRHLHRDGRRGVTVAELRDLLNSMRDDDLVVVRCCVDSSVHTLDNERVHVYYTKGDASNAALIPSVILDHDDDYRTVES